MFQQNSKKAGVLPSQIATAQDDYEENNKQLRLTMALLESMVDSSETSENIAKVLTKATNIISNILFHNDYSRQIMKSCSLLEFEFDAAVAHTPKERGKMETKREDIK